MSVTKQEYLMYGWKLDQDMHDADGNEIDWNSDELADLHDDEDFAIIVDGMSGEYVVVGKIIVQGVSNHDGEGGFEEVHEFDLAKIEKLKKGLLKTYKKLLNSLPATEPKLLIFSHYS